MHPTNGVRLAVLVLIALFAAVTARAGIGSYVFTEGTGERIDISSGSTTVFDGNDACNGYNVDDASVSAVDIGFTFRYDGVDYSRFSVSTNGLIGLFTQWGTTSVSSCWTNYLNQVTGGCSDPYGLTLDSIAQIAPLWDDLRVPSTCNSDGFNGRIHYMLVGEAPNRVLVIEYRDIEWAYYARYYGTWQARLYETSNRIDFWYGGFTGNSSGSASIGLAGIDGSSFMSVSPGTPSWSSTWSTNDYIDVRNIPANTLYTFTPCELQVLAPSGGEVLPQALVDGTDILGGVRVFAGSRADLSPMLLSASGSPCGWRSFRIAIENDFSGEYSVYPSEGSIEPGTTTMPTISYAPRCDGYRPATLRVSFDDGTERVFVLGAIAAPALAWTPDLASGGTEALADGDTLLNGAIVMRRQVTDFRPLTIEGLNYDAAAAPQQVTFELIDPGNQYRLSTTEATLRGGESVSPTITFLAENVSYQEATLIVRTDCETRTYLLRAFSAAPAGVLSAGEPLTPETSIFGSYARCIASEQEIIPVQVTNTGYGDFLLTGVAFLRTDTLQNQGAPPFPLLRDPFGRTIASSEYRLLASPTGPVLTLPYAVPQGETRTIYAAFTGRESGRRYARAFIRSNGEGFMNTDAEGAEVEGLFVFDVLGRGVGSLLAGGVSGERLRPVVLPAARLDEVTTATFTVANAGACDLLIRRDKLRITGGDVNEFTLVEVLQGIPIDAAANSYRIAPGTSGTITVRFAPSRSGTRMATLLLQTNDSSISMPGLTERGAYRLDLHGFGRAGLDFSRIAFAPVLVGGVVEGIATLENSANVAVEVREISIVGENAAEFQASAARPWPALPTLVPAGGRLVLAVELRPVGEAGMRHALLQVITTTDDTMRVPMHGEAGVAALEVGPTTLFDGEQVGIGQYLRRTVTITNKGTFPIRLQAPVVTGTDVDNYSLGSLPRHDLVPGQSEFLEVTFQPTQEGASSAMLEIRSSVGTHVVQLGGASMGAYGGGGPVNEPGAARSATTGRAPTLK